MDITLISAAFVLSVLIFTHELGHFLAAKMVGVRVLRFSIGFGPRLIGIERGGTDYRISLVPFGGYVKLSGMEDTEAEGREDEFSSKWVGARIWIIVAGPLANFVLAFLLFFIITSAIGTPILETTRVGSVEDGSPAFTAGIRPRDEILMIGETEVGNWYEVMEEISRRSGGVSVKVQRDEDELWFVMDLAGDPGILPFLEPVVGRVQKESPAEEAGLRQGDRIVSIGDRRVETFDDILQVIQASADTTIQIAWIRDGEHHRAMVKPKSTVTVVGGDAEKVGVIGIRMDYSRLRLPLGQALSISFQEVIYRTELILVFLGRLITGRASVRNVGGIIYMTAAAGETARLGIDFLLSFMAMISLNLFLINLLPIPVLDGGHIVYNLTEAIRGRPLSLRQKMIAQQIGLAIIIVIFAFVILNDIMRFVR